MFKVRVIDVIDFKNISTRFIFIHKLALVESLADERDISNDDIFCVCVCVWSF